MVGRSAHSIMDRQYKPREGVKHLLGVRHLLGVEGFMESKDNDGRFRFDSRSGLDNGIEGSTLI